MSALIVFSGMHSFCWKMHAHLTFHMCYVSIINRAICELSRFSQRCQMQSNILLCCTNDVLRPKPDMNHVTLACWQRKRAWLTSSVIALQMPQEGWIVEIIFERAIPIGSAFCKILQKNILTSGRTPGVFQIFFQTYFSFDEIIHLTSGCNCSSILYAPFTENTPILCPFENNHILKPLSQYNITVLWPYLLHQYSTSKHF